MKFIFIALFLFTSHEAMAAGQVAANFNDFLGVYGLENCVTTKAKEEGSVCDLTNVKISIEQVDGLDVLTLDMLLMGLSGSSEFKSGLAVVGAPRVSCDVSYGKARCVLGAHTVESSMSKAGANVHVEMIFDAGNPGEDRIWLSLVK